MHSSFSAVNENADENEIPFSAEKRKRKSPVSNLRFIFGITQMTLLERNWKIHFRPKTKKNENDQIALFGAENENEFRSDSMAWPEWPWPPQILRQIYATAGCRYLILGNKQQI